MLWIDLGLDERLAILTQTATNEGIVENAVEKDWWVSMILKSLFQLSCSEHLVFKGGTSLSKGWKIIERFSEDIDLGISPAFLGFPEFKSRTNLQKLRKECRKYVANDLMPELDNILQRNNVAGYKLEFFDDADPDADPAIIFVPYNSILTENQYVPARIKIEISCRSLREPFEARPMRSLIAENYPDEEFAEDVFNVNTVLPSRTFLEKIFLLHEEFSRPPEKRRSERMSRHLYDLEKLMATDFAEDALSDKEMYMTIVNHRFRFTKVGDIDYNKHHPSTINCIPPDDMIGQWRADYVQMKEAFIHGSALEFDKLLNRITELNQRINNIEIDSGLFNFN